MAGLKTVREAAKLTQQQLGAAAGIDAATVARLELDPQRYLQAHYRTVIRIARVLRKRPDDLFPVPPLDTGGC